MYIDTKFGTLFIQKVYSNVSDALKDGYKELFVSDNGKYAIYSKSACIGYKGFHYAKVCLK